MQNGMNIDVLLDALADRLAERVTDRMAGDNNPRARNRRLFTIEQAAIYLSRSEKGVRGMISSGKIPCVRGDRRIMLDVRDLDEWIDKNKYDLTDIPT